MNTRIPLSTFEINVWIEKMAIFSFAFSFLFFLSLMSISLPPITTGHCGPLVVWSAPRGEKRARIYHLLEAAPRHSHQRTNLLAQKRNAGAFA